MTRDEQLAADLRALEAAGRIASAWRPGMRGVSGLWMAGWDEAHDTRREEFFGAPDPTDPATLGCLMAVLREATGIPRLVLVPHLYPSHDGWMPSESVPEPWFSLIWRALTPDPSTATGGHAVEIPEADAVCAAIRAVAAEVA